MAKDMPPPVVYSPAAHTLPYWSHPAAYYPMGPPAPPSQPVHYARYHQPHHPPSLPQHELADKQLAADMASLAFSDIMQAQMHHHHPQPHPLYHPPSASYLLPAARQKQATSLPPVDYRHGSQFSSSPISDMTDESTRRYGRFFWSFNTQYYSLWFSILRPCDTRMPNWYAPPNRKHAKKKTTMLYF
jgi:hypothetical protein